MIWRKWTDGRPQRHHNRHVTSLHDPSHLDFFQHLWTVKTWTTAVKHQKTIIIKKISGKSQFAFSCFWKSAFSRTFTVPVATLWRIILFRLKKKKSKCKINTSITSQYECKYNICHLNIMTQPTDFKRAGKWIMTWVWFSLSVTSRRSNRTRTHFLFQPNKADKSLTFLQITISFCLQPQRWKRGEFRVNCPFSWRRFVFFHSFWTKYQSGIFD